MQTIYGPIPSRRLGQSLGVDPVPLKTCNWNCVYCQLGRSVQLETERRVYVPTELIVEELQAFFAQPEPPPVDWISFVGSGEPTLHRELGVLIRAAKSLRRAPVAVLTNGTLLSDAEVRRDLAEADLVMPTLSAADPKLHLRIHRPHPSLTFERHVEGLKAFRREFNGRLWIEVMLLRGVNDDATHLTRLAALIRAIGADEVQITLPTRPPAEPWVEPPDAEGLMAAVAILGQDLVLGHPHLNCYRLAADTPAGYAEALWATIRRHPMSEAQVAEALANCGPDVVAEVMRLLETDVRLRRIERHGVCFWVDAGARFVSASSSAR